MNSTFIGDDNIIHSAKKKHIVLCKGFRQLKWRCFLKKIPWIKVRSIFAVTPFAFKPAPVLLSPCAHSVSRSLAGRLFQYLGEAFAQYSRCCFPLNLASAPLVSGSGEEMCVWVQMLILTVVSSGYRWGTLDARADISTAKGRSPWSWLPALGTPWTQTQSDAFMHTLIKNKYPTSFNLHCFYGLIEPLMDSRTITQTYTHTGLLDVEHAKETLTHTVSKMTR